MDTPSTIELPRTLYELLDDEELAATCSDWIWQNPSEVERENTEARRLCAKLHWMGVAADSLDRWPDSYVFIGRQDGSYYFLSKREPEGTVYRADSINDPLFVEASWSNPRSMAIELLEIVPADELSDRLTKMLDAYNPPPMAQRLPTGHIDNFRATFETAATRSLKGHTIGYLLMALVLFGAGAYGAIATSGHWRVASICIAVIGPLSARIDLWGDRNRRSFARTMLEAETI